MHACDGLDDHGEVAGTFQWRFADSHRKLQLNFHPQGMNIITLSTPEHNHFFPQGRAAVTPCTWSVEGGYAPSSAG